MGLVCGMSALAAPLTPQQALERARQDAPAKVAAKIKADLNPVYAAKTVDGQPAAYVFNNPAAGYVILAGDDVAYPVLAYSENGRIDPANMSPELKWWLSEYGRQIKWANERGASEAVKAPRANSEWTAIAPMCKTEWNQDAPYNDDCPLYEGQRSVTGCVATSMAQVMKYHNYPQVGEGIKLYYCESIGKRLSINFSHKEFDWDNMLDAYYKDEYNADQAAAVAYLMKACGYSVEMKYHPSASGTQGSKIGAALVEYFKYDGNCRTMNRDIYSGSQWMEMVYDNLKNVGPMVINGQSPTQGGHSFVCDGYDGKGYFHFNWGWGGVSDGYYALDALNPDAQGIGGASGGFNFSQNGVFGIQPPTGLPVEPDPDRVMLYGSATASISGRTITFNVIDSDQAGYGNGSGRDINVKIGSIITPIDGTSGSEQTVAATLGSMSQITLSASSYYPADRVNWIVNVPTLPDGKYRVTLATQQVSDDPQEWYPVLVTWGYQNSCVMTVSGQNYTVESIPVSNIQVSDLQLGSTLYSGKNVLLKAKFTNNSDIELTKGVCPALYTGSTRKYVGESILVTLQPGESVEKEWLVKFLNPSTGSGASVSTPTDFTLKLYDPQGGSIYDVSLDVTMEKNPGGARLMLTDFTIPGAPLEELDVNGQHYNAISKVSNLAEIPFSFTVKNSSGYYDGQITLGIYEQDSQNPRRMVPVKQDIYVVYPFLAKNEEISENLNIDFSEGEEGVLYFVYGQNTLGSSINVLGSRPFMFGYPSGVDEIELGGDEAVEYYNLQGCRIDNPLPGQLVIVRKGGKSTKQVWR